MCVLFTISVSILMVITAKPFPKKSPKFKKKFDVIYSRFYSMSILCRFYVDSMFYVDPFSILVFLLRVSCKIIYKF